MRRAGIWCAGIVNGLGILGETGQQEGEVTLVDGGEVVLQHGADADMVGDFGIGHLDSPPRASAGAFTG